MNNIKSRVATKLSASVEDVKRVRTQQDSKVLSSLKQTSTPALKYTSGLNINSYLKENTNMTKEKEDTNHIPFLRPKQRKVGDVIRITYVDADTG